MLAGLHNPQGRAIALTRLMLLAPNDVLALVPRELAGVVATRLSRFVLRSKVRVLDESAQWSIAGLTAPPELAMAEAPAPQGAAVARLSTDSQRWFRAAQTGNTPAPRHASDREFWRAMDVAAGLPQVYGSTSEAFLAQMLNLDVVGGVAFDKGCYTGQEIIARAHYRGRVKRRMQRFRSQAASGLIAGATGTLADGRTCRVVEAVRLPDGSCEFLAVTTLAAGGPDEEAAGTAVASPGAPFHAEQLALPYELPE
jgi:hypothetical protein